MRDANVTEGPGAHRVRLFLRAQIKSSSRDRLSSGGPRFFLVLSSPLRSRNHGGLIKASGLSVSKPKSGPSTTCLPGE